MVLKPGKEAEAEAIFRKWGLDFAIVGRTTDDLRFVVKHQGEVDGRPADQGARRRGAGLRPARTSPTPSSRCSRPRASPAPVSNAEALLTLVGSPDLSSQALGLGAVRPPDPRQHPAAPGRRRRRSCASTDGPKGLALTSDVTPRYCEADPVRGRQAGRGRGLAQPHRRRRPAARRHRQPQLRQSRAAGDHGPARRLHPRHRRGLPGARLPGRLRQRLALQRDQRPRHPADADDRRRRPDRRRDAACARIALQARRATRSCWSARRRGWLGQSIYLREICGREDGAPPPVDLAAEKTQRRLRARPDPRRARRHGARPLRRRPRRRARRDGDGRRRSARSSRRCPVDLPATPSCSARTRPATCSRSIRTRRRTSSTRPRADGHSGRRASA